MYWHLETPVDLLINRPQHDHHLHQKNGLATEGPLTIPVFKIRPSNEHVPAKLHVMLTTISFVINDK